MEEKSIPLRFRDRRANSNPMFETTASDYGNTPPSEATQVLKRYAKSNNFSKNFVGGMYSNSSLNTAMDKKFIDNADRVSSF